MLTLSQDDINEMQRMIADFRYADAVKLIEFINRKMAAQNAPKVADAPKAPKANGDGAHIQEPA